MTDPRAFISFDFDHNDQSKIRFVGQSKNSRVPFTISEWSAKSSMPQSQWEEIVKNKINKTNMVIVLVGRHMASATGVVKEIQMARELNVPCFGVYVDSANTSSNLPAGLVRGRTIKWTWLGVANAMNQMMKEGKKQKINYE